MTLRRVCTIQGRAYEMTGRCTVCDTPMWTTMTPPTVTAGCTTTDCLHDRHTHPPIQPEPDATGVPHDPPSPRWDPEEDGSQ